MPIHRLGLFRATVGAIIGAVFGAVFAIACRALLGWTLWGTPEATEGWSAVAAVFGTIGWMIGAGAMTDWWSWIRGKQAGEPDHGDPHAPQWPRYFNYDGNHKIIGIQYAVTAVLTLLLGGAMALTFRLELAQPGIQIFTQGRGDTYNSLLSLHGMIMIAGNLMGVAAMGNYLIPLMVGAPDMAFPRLNAFSYWISMPAVILLVTAWLVGGVDHGWTAYPPLSTRSGLGAQFFLLAIFIFGFGSIVGSVNFMVTIFRMRVPGMSLFRMPIFIWGMLATSLIQFIATQFIAMSFLMVLFQRWIGLNFFDSVAGNVVYYQHIFWFYSHPAVYVFVLPGLGVISELLPVFARKPLFGYRWVALSSMFIAIVGFLVWAHHMFTTNLGNTLNTLFSVTTALVAVPTGVKFFSWIATLWEGKISFEVPMLFVLGAFVVFLIGGLSGPPNAYYVSDVALHDTYWVVAHFHHTMFGGFIFPFIAAVFFWFPKATGRMFNKRLGQLQFWLIFIGFHMKTIPMFLIGLQGMRRRIVDYSELGFGTNQLVTTVGAYLIGTSFLIFVYNIWVSARKGAPAPANPWGARSIEWLTSSPPIDQNYDRLPIVVGEPYDYGLPGSVYAQYSTAGAAGDD